MIRDALSLLLWLGAVAWFVWGRAPDLPARASSPVRHALYRRLLLKTALAFLLPGLIGLVALGRLDALWRMPDEFAGLGALSMFAAGDIWPLVAGLAGGAAIGQALAWWAVRRGRRPFAIGNIDHLLPRVRGELAYGLALSATAGVAEELFFRLLLPLLIARVSGSAWAGFGVSLILFAGMHRYQGWAGVLGTAFAGAVLSAVYVGTGELWAAMLLHAGIDLNSLVLRPVVTGLVRGPVRFLPSP